SHLDCHDRLVDLEALGEVDCALDLARRGIKHADRPALFGGYPNGAAVVEEQDKARAAADGQTVEQFARRGLDEMGEIGGFRGCNDELAIRADADASWFGPDLDLA